MSYRPQRVQDAKGDLGTIYCMLRHYITPRLNFNRRFLRSTIVYTGLPYIIACWEFDLRFISYTRLLVLLII